MAISLPPAIVRQLDAVRKQKSRTRSELVLEVLRQYFAKRLPASLTKGEMAAIRRFRAKRMWRASRK
ncbi:MAG: hypothetical protein A3G20_06650 [Acidobacteria bacterium RIFCSPLOWO2_12_FULL_59_11]|nr:MAG: hypothetical protein A3G20_06650 [Acidobacteria bacterium RIFCSPLOWO2_12_FULL_59_11]